jgi:hypothetical protein
MKKLSPEEFKNAPSGIQFIADRERLEIDVPDSIYELARNEHPEYFK